MKPTIYFLTFVTCLAFLAFSSPSSNNTKTDNFDLEEQTTVTDTISINTFRQWTHNWKLYGKNYTQILLTEYFTMPKNNFVQILATNPASIRGHMGLDTTTNPYTAHLIVVGVDANGQDMVDYNNGLYYYDFSDACPINCPQR